MNRIQVLVALFFFSLLVGVPQVEAQNNPTIYVGLVSVTPSNTPVLSGIDGGYFMED